MPRNFQYRYLITILLTYISLGFLTRMILFLSFPMEGLNSPGETAQVFFLGMFNDVAGFLYIGLLPAAIVLLPFWGKSEEPGCKTRAAAFLFFWLLLAFWLFGAVAEYCFWEEFGTRFNFIAVDYLVYTHELVQNIIESYNMPLILGGIFSAALAAAYLILSNVFRPLYKPASVGPDSVSRASGSSSRHLNSPVRTSGKMRRLAYALVMTFWVAILGGLYWGYNPPAAFRNNLSNELSYNGLYRLFSAYWNNQLDYRQFYPVMPDSQALSILKKELSEPGVIWDRRPESLARLTHTPNGEQRLNVIQIVVESLGSNHLGENTPNLNKLMKESLYFGNLRATGTRTVRGIEALTLGVPPTPGSSIVRRPGNEGLFNIGTVFQERDYDTTFVYGGFGYFDNMNSYFSGNGWKVIDRYAMPKSDISFANVWGVCDEDLYRTALKAADASYEQGRNFYQFVLTTSNHRPFTYPEGKVAIASGQGRQGAVQYSDYAIGRFLEEAKNKPWFKDTIFVIVADHTAGVAGKTVIPPHRYLIPALVYSPGRIKPEQIDTLCSQIDLPPTILSFLGIDYEGAFFGRNITSLPPEEGRAYLGTYQLLGLMDNNSLAVLAPNQEPFVETLTPDGITTTKDDSIIQRAIAAYQTTQDFFIDGRMKIRYLENIALNKPAHTESSTMAALKKRGNGSNTISEN